MIWAAMCGQNGLSRCHIMSRDPDSGRGGYSSNSYLDILEDELPDYYEPGLIFMQDNAGIYIAYIVRDFFEENGIWVMEWPPYSLDLNPIEHL